MNSKIPDAMSLVNAAIRAMENAYCPYSQYPVGAAVRDAGGNVYVGCNIENAAYGSTLCAEAGALAAARANGASEIEAVAVVTRNGGMPCGNCRQLLFELAPQATLTVTRVSDPASYRSFTVQDILPDPFTGTADND